MPAVPARPGQASPPTAAPNAPGELGMGVTAATVTVPKTLVMDAPAGPTLAVAVFPLVWTATCSAPTTGSVVEPSTRLTRTSWTIWA